MSTKRRVFTVAEGWRDVPDTEPEQVTGNTFVKTCLNCRFLREQDEGYSNWTVLGYKADCMFGLNSFNSEDADHDQKAAIGAECPHWTDGPRLQLDVDDENDQHEAAIRDWIKLVRLWQ